MASLSYGGFADHKGLKDLEDIPFNLFEVFVV
jgi:hypothetical protein